MNYRTTVVLLLLFFAGLIGLWWADSAKVLTSLESRRRQGLVLPGLADVAPGDVRRIEVAGEGGPPLVFDRREGDLWQMRAPADALADRSMIDALVSHLKNLKR